MQCQVGYTNKKELDSQVPLWVWLLALDIFIPMLFQLLQPHVFGNIANKDSEKKKKTTTWIYSASCDFFPHRYTYTPEVISCNKVRVKSSSGLP